MPEPLRLSISQKIFVSKDGKDWYVTSVQEKDNNQFCIGVPYQKSQPLICYRGEKIICKFSNQEGAFQFTTDFLGRTTDQVPLYLLSLPEYCNRIQQRNFVRLSTLIPVQYATLPENDEKPAFKEGTTVDLSGGGMKLAIKEPYRPGVNLIIRFQLAIKDETFDFELKGKIQRLEIKEVTPKDRVFHAGIEFLNISRRDQDRIVAFIFARMAKQNQLR